MNRLSIVIALLFLATTAHAGDRRVDTLIVNMTPDAASTEPSKQCVKAIETHVRAEYSEVTRMGETPLRERVGKTAGEPMLTWTAEDLARARHKGEAGMHDAVILIDCRPELKMLDVVVTSADPNLTHFLLRRVEPNRKRLTLVAQAIMRRAWLGF